MSNLTAIWPIARGSLNRNRVRYLVMAALLGLAVASYLLYATFMIGANVEAGLAMEEHRLPADIVFLGRQSLQPDVIAEWSRRSGVVELAPLRQTRYVTEHGSLRVLAIPAGSPAWALALGSGGDGGGEGGEGGGGGGESGAPQVPMPRANEILLPPGLYARLVEQAEGSGGGPAGAGTLTMLPPGAPPTSAREWRVIGAHTATDSIVGSSALVLLAEPGPLPNSMLIWTRGQAMTNSLAAILEVDYLAPTRPVLYEPEDPAVVTTRSAEALAEGILGQTYMPGFGIMTMVFIFSGIGLFTVSSLGFLDRKRDLAILKTVGMENAGGAALFLLEQGAIALLGFALGLIVAGVAIGRLAAYIPASQGLTGASVIKAVISGLLIQGAGVVVPALTARVATVNQLLYDQPIPLYYRRVHQSEV